jgi:hypothetical protein
VTDIEQTAREVGPTIESQRERLAVVQEARELFLGTPLGNVPEGLEQHLDRWRERLARVGGAPGAGGLPPGIGTAVVLAPVPGPADIPPGYGRDPVLDAAERDGYLTLVSGQPKERKLRKAWMARCAAAGRPSIEVVVQDAKGKLASVVFAPDPTLLYDENRQFETISPDPRVLALFVKYSKEEPMTWSDAVELSDIPFQVAITIARRLVALPNVAPDSALLGTSSPGQPSGSRGPGPQ